MNALFPSVYMIESEVGGRPLQLTYLKGQEASLLLDTGCSSDPEATLSTLQLIDHLPISTYMGCHWPVKEYSRADRKAAWES